MSTKREASSSDRIDPATAGSIGAVVDTLQLVEERLQVSRKQVVTGMVRVATRTETHEGSAEFEVDRYRLEVTRVPIDRIVDVAPEARSEGDTTILPVLEERFVLVKQLVLKEELHIRHVIEREAVRESVPLRRQVCTVERHPVPVHREAKGPGTSQARTAAE